MGGDRYGQAEAMADMRALQRHRDPGVRAMGRLCEKLYPVIEEWWDAPEQKALPFLVPDRVLIMAMANAYACCIVDAVKPGGAEAVASHALDIFRAALEQGLERQGGDTGP